MWYRWSNRPFCGGLYSDAGRASRTNALSLSSSLSSRGDGNGERLVAVDAGICEKMFDDGMLLVTDSPKRESIII